MIYDESFTLVSPGFTSRPSLSVDEPVDDRVDRQCVAGIHVPAFVERWPKGVGKITAENVCRRDSRPGLR